MIAPVRQANKKKQPNPALSPNSDRAPTLFMRILQGLTDSLVEEPMEYTPYDNVHSGRVYTIFRDLMEDVMYKKPAGVPSGCKT
jgi:hypothetical protein